MNSKFKLLFLLSVLLFTVSSGNNIVLNSENETQLTFNDNPVGNIKAVVITVDSYTDSEMNNISQSVKKDYASILQMFNLLETRNLFTVDKYYLRGNKTSKNDILSTISNLNTNPNDVIFVYFSGHGGMDSQGTFLVSREGEFVYRKDVERILNSKSAKLKFLVTDACANDIDGFAVTRSFSSSDKSYTGANDQIYKSLFSDYEGFVNIASSSKGEYSWSDDSKGGYFTYFFIKEAIMKKPSNSWKNIFETAKDKVVKMGQRVDNESRGSDDEITSQTPVAYSMPASRGEILNYTLPVNNNNLLNNSESLITIKNNTRQSITCYFETENESNNTSGTPLSPGNTIKLQTYTTIYFDDGKEEAGYELEGGEYVFEETNRGMIDLFIDEDEENVNSNDYENGTGNYNQNNSSSPARYENMILGEWELEVDNYSYVVKFSSNKQYEIHDSDDEIIERGNWEVATENEDNEQYDVLILETDTDEGLLEEYYEIFSDDSYTMELYLIGRYIDDEEDSSFSDEDETIYLLYRY